MLEITAMRKLGLTLSHDLRTPLLSIKAGTEGVKNFLPALLDAYQKAKKAGISVTEMDAHHLELLGRVLDNVEAATEEANELITRFAETVQKDE